MLNVLSADQILTLVFVVSSVLFLLIDLGVFSKNKAHITTKRAVAWTFVWIALAMAFNLLIYYFKGKEVAMEFLAGYVLEKSLSVDNLFVFIMIFSHFNISLNNQQRILKLGIIGAFFMRLFFIFLGVALMEQFHFMIYVFGAFLVFTGIKMLIGSDQKFDPEKSYIFGLLVKWIPFKNINPTNKFVVRIDKKLYATPLLFCLIFIELSDLVFAVDSIPAILSVTQDRFIVLSSNIFAILGLRSLYFALASVVEKFWLLGHSIAVVLVFVGVKLGISGFYKIDIGVSLIVILVALAAGVIASIVFPKKEEVVE